MSELHFIRENEHHEPEVIDFSMLKFAQTMGTKVTFSDGIAFSESEVFAREAAAQIARENG